MAQVIRYLLLLNHPEDSDFSGDTTFKDRRVLMLVYLFIHLSVHLCFTIALKLRQQVILPKEHLVK